MKLHLTRRQQLNALAVERRGRQKRIDELQDEYMRTHHVLALDQKALDGEKGRLAALRLKLKACTAQHKEAQAETGKLKVMLRRTKEEWVGGMARMQDIGQYANEQVQGLFRGSQWRMYNELLKEVAAFKLTNMHVESTQLERERQVQIDTRRDELQVLQELNQLMIVGREEADRERKEMQQQKIESQAKNAEVKQATLTVSQIQQATQMLTKVDRALDTLARHGHQFSEFDTYDRTVLDDILDRLLHQRKLRMEASEAKKERAEKVAQLTAQLEPLEKQLVQLAYPAETPEPDMDDKGNLSPRALGHGHSIRTIQEKQQLLQRQLNAKTLVLNAVEHRASEVMQWFKRLTPAFEPFVIYRKKLEEEVKAINPTGTVVPADHVSCWLKSIETTLGWVKMEVNKYRAELGREELDWQAFSANGFEAVEEGKVVCIDRAVNLRVLTEEQEAERQAAARQKQIAEYTKAEVAAEKAAQYGGKPICESCYTGPFHSDCNQSAVLSPFIMSGHQV